MKALIYFPESSRVEPHTADIDTLPRQGDFLDLPDVSNQHVYTVERVIFLLSRLQSGEAILCAPQEPAPQVRIYLGSAVEKPK
jgi:hypothetical protein